MTMTLSQAVGSACTRLFDLEPQTIEGAHKP